MTEETKLLTYIIEYVDNSKREYEVQTPRDALDYFMMEGDHAWTYYPKAEEEQ